MIATLRPGYLVSLKTTISGGASYAKRDIAEVRDGVSVSTTWETTRHVECVEEYEAARRCRAAAAATIRRACIETGFGLLCPTANVERLDAAIATASAAVTEFNASAKTVNVYIGVLRGRIADTDTEAAEAIAGEMRELLDQMQAGIRRMDVGTIRAAAAQARRFEAMLDSARADRVSEAVKAARAAATEIVRRIKRDGEAAEAIAIDFNSKPIELARFAFLDTDDAAPAQDDGAVEIPSIVVQRFADVAEPEPVEA